MLKEESKLTRVLFNILLIFGILFLFNQLTDFLDPLISVVFFFLKPLILVLFIYYALKPLKKFLRRFIKNETLVFIITILVFLAIIVLLLSLTTSIIIEQGKDFASSLDFNQIYQENESWLGKIEQFFHVENALEKTVEEGQKLALKLTDNFSAIVSNIYLFAGNITNFFAQLLFIMTGLIFTLKDEKYFGETIKDFLGRRKHGEELKTSLKNINNVLEIYVSGQLLIALILGILAFIGYKIIGLPNALLLSLIALVTNLIPFIGPIIGTIPAMIIGLTVGLSSVIKVVVVAVIIQQVESNIVTPLVTGSKLDIHPLVVIVITFISMQLFGVIGALIASPLYLIIVELVKLSLRIHRKQKTAEMERKTITKEKTVIETK